VTEIGDKKRAAFASHIHCGSWKEDASLMAFTQTIRTFTELFIRYVISWRHESQETAVAVN
jgi:hypothetical protein